MQYSCNPNQSLAFTRPTPSEAKVYLLVGQHKDLPIETSLSPNEEKCFSLSPYTVHAPGVMWTLAGASSTSATLQVIATSTGKHFVKVEQTDAITSKKIEVQIDVEVCGNLVMRSDWAPPE